MKKSALWLFLLLVPAAMSQVSFDAPATMGGTLSIEPASTTFIKLPSGGQVSLEGADLVASIREWRQVDTIVVSDAGAYRETYRSHFQGDAQGHVLSNGTAEISDLTHLLGSGTGNLRGDLSSCQFKGADWRDFPCSTENAGWLIITMHDFEAVGQPAWSSWTETSWNQSLPASTSETTVVGPDELRTSVITQRTGLLEGRQNLTIRAPLAEIHVALSGIQVEGSLELPNYNSESESSPNLIAEGSFVLDNLTFQNGRFEADMSGDVKAARLDNDVVSADALGWATAGAVGTAAVAVVLWKLAGGGLIAGFTRLTMEEALEHPKRQHVFGYIVDHPGATFREVVRETGFATGTTRHHLTILKRSSAIMEQKHAQTLRYFENHGRYEQSWDTITLLREAPLAQLHGWLTKNPLCNQKAILAAMMEEGWSRSTTQHRLSRLVDGGLVSMRPQGRMNLYQAHSQVQRN